MKGFHMRTAGDAKGKCSGRALSRRERGVHEEGSLCFWPKTEGLQADFRKIQTAEN